MTETPMPLDLSIVIPAYKEAAKIERDIHAAEGFLEEAGLRGEIIVVDDGSPDETGARAAALKTRYPNLEVLSYQPNRGKGHALRYGIARATGRIVMFADSGLCVPYENAKLGIALIDSGLCDIAHGSRRVRGSVVVSQPLYRRIGSLVFRLLAHSLMGVPPYVSDTQCGFKLYRREVARSLYGASFIDGMMFDTEIILRAARANYRILEFPIRWNMDPDTSFRPGRGSLRAFRELWKLRVALSPFGRRPGEDRPPVKERDPVREGGSPATAR